MNDPLGLISGANGAAAMGRARSAAGLPVEPGQQGAFAKSLLSQIDEVSKLQAEAGQAVEDAMTGKRDDIENVMIGAQKADAAFRMLLSLRNKVQAAYDEIKQVRV